MQNYWTVPFPSRYSDTDDMRWEAFGAVWTHIEVLGRVFGCFCLLGACACSMVITDIHILRYRWYKWDMMIHMRYNDTDEIWWYIWDMMIHMRYRPLGSVWVHIEVLGRVLGHLVLTGPDYTCTNMMRYMRYEMAFSRLFVVAPGHDGSWLHVRRGLNMMRLFPWVLVWW